MSMETGKSEFIRLQVVLAKAGVSSRRGAERLILSGRVTVNGQVCQKLGTKVGPNDTVTLDGLTIGTAASPLYLALHKPAGYLCSMADSFGRPLASSLFLPEVTERLFHVGRLDLESSGLIFYTNDGDFAMKAGHPAYGLIKEYEVFTDKAVHRSFPDQFMEGLSDSAGMIRAKQVVLMNPKELRIQLIEGRNREIRRALLLFGLHATRLHRIVIGPVQLGLLPTGSWRHLSDVELAALNALFSEHAPDGTGRVE